MAFLEDLISYLESIIVLFSIPYAYMETRESKFDKLTDIIEQLSDVILNRIANGNLVSRHEMETLILSYTLKHNFSKKAILLDDVLDRIMTKVETNLFITKNIRRSIIEKIVNLRTNERSIKLTYYLFIKNNKLVIFNLIIIGILIVTLLFPEKWQIFRNISQYKAIAFKLGIGLVITLISFSILRFIITLSNGKIFEGEPPFDINSFKYLPDYYNEFLLFRFQENYLRLDLKDVAYELNDKVVETDQGCLPFGIIKFHKKLRIYSISFFNDEKKISLKISIEKRSFKNGTVDFDQIEYSYATSSIEKTVKLYPQRNEIDDFSLIDDFAPSSDSPHPNLLYGDSNSEEDTIVLNNKKKLHAIRIDGILWELVSNNTSTQDNS